MRRAADKGAVGERKRAAFRVVSFATIKTLYYFIDKQFGLWDYLFLAVPGASGLAGLTGCVAVVCLSIYSYV